MSRLNNLSVAGISFCMTRQKYVARVTVSKAKRKMLGRFDSMYLARKAIEDFKKEAKGGRE